MCFSSDIKGIKGVRHRKWKRTNISTSRSMQSNYTINQCPNQSLKFWCTNTHPPLIIFANNSPLDRNHYTLPKQQYTNRQVSYQSNELPFTNLRPSLIAANSSPYFQVHCKIWFWGYLGHQRIPRENHSTAIHSTHDMIGMLLLSPHNSLSLGYVTWYTNTKVINQSKVIFIWSS